MNKLKAWIDGEWGRGVKLAKHLGCLQPFVHKMSVGQKPVPVGHAAAIEKFTGGAVTRKDMFPDSWERIWPELATTSTTNHQES
jgi:DNA-binding transcriptional regulator YdaS (Cro superfamily)